MQGNDVDLSMHTHPPACSSTRLLACLPTCLLAQIGDLTVTHTQIHTLSRIHRSANTSPWPVQTFASTATLPASSGRRQRSWGLPANNNAFAKQTTSSPHGDLLRTAGWKVAVTMIFANRAPMEVTAPQWAPLRATSEPQMINGELRLTCSLFSTRARS